MPCTDHETTTDATESRSQDYAPRTPCEGCGIPVPNGSICDDCVTCGRCRNQVPEEQTIETVRGSTICQPCQRTWYWQCSSCDGWNRDGRDCANDCCNDSCNCYSCRDDDEGNLSDLVHPYSYQPRPVFHGTGPLYLGPEIEIETPDGRYRECAEIAGSFLGDLGYLKTDSSVDNGFEIVTHPMSYQWAMDHFPWQMLTDLQQCGAEATESTGIHVHVSRAGFATSCHAYRWMKFIYRNQPQVTIVARRSSGQWAAFTDHDRRAVKDYAKGGMGNRYRAINTNNTDTFELRIFASSLDPREVKAALAFAAASVEYTRHLTVHQIAADGGWSWRAFADWVTEQPAFRPLSDELEALACVS